MTLKPAFSAALLALFAAACQPAATPAAEGPAPAESAAAPEAPAPAGPSELAKFQTGQFEKLDLDTELSIPTAKFVDAEGKEHSFADYAGKDVVVVPVAFGFGKGVTRETTAAKFKELTGGDLPFYYDGELEVNGQAQTGALPATIIYDKSGKEVARLIYPAKWDAPDAVALVQAVLDGQS